MSAEGSPTVRAVRALVPPPRSDLRPHDRDSPHWLFDTKIATPMSRWPEYRAERRSWGIDAVGSFAVEVEASDGTLGVGASVGGPAAAFLVERHLARFVEGRPLTRESIADAWERMFHASLPYGRRGLAVHALSAVDLALWDALGRACGLPVWALLGDRRHERLPLYATTPHVDAARRLGFVGGKLPLPAGAAEGGEGHRENVAAATRAAELCGGAADGFFLAVDCFMSLDVESAARLADELAPLGYTWLEEPLPPDDYRGHAELRRRLGGRLRLATGEHEATVAGFRLLADWECADVVQPDIAWCGGLTELLRIAALADERGLTVVPHGSSAFTYHFSVTRPQTPFAEFAFLDPDGVEIVPQLAPLLVDEPLPAGGHVRVPDTPGFGVELGARDELERPFPH